MIMLPYVFALFLKKRLQNSQLKTILLLVTVALSACETNVDIDVPAHTPRLAVQFNLRSDATSQEIFIGRSQGVLSSDDLWRNGAVKNAEITIKDAQGITRQSFDYVPYTFDVQRGHYKSRSNFSPQPGQAYTLTVAAPGFETIQSTVTLPQTVPIASASFQPNSQNNNQNSYTGRLRLEFNDLANQPDYYRIVARVVDSKGETVSSVFQNYENDDIFGEQVEQIMLNKVFDDGWARQGVISFTANVGYFGDYSGSNPPAAMEITVEHITQDLYLYERSRNNYQEDNPFSEPLNLHSNIRNGYGNFGGITSTTYRIQL